MYYIIMYYYNVVKCYLYLFMIKLLSETHKINAIPKIALLPRLVGRVTKVSFPFNKNNKALMQASLMGGLLEYAEK